MISSLPLNDTSIFILNRDLAFAFFCYLILMPFVYCLAEKKIGPDDHSWIGRGYRELKEWFIPVLVIFIIRAFFYEMYFIPSGSMQPTLYAWDVVLVNKYDYGFKIPGTNTTFYSMREPKHGEVVVFLDPQQPTKRKMIKRLIGRPGDHIVMKNDTVTINGQTLPAVFDHQSFEYVPGHQGASYRIETSFYQQQWGNRFYMIEHMPQLKREWSIDLHVPQGYYFVLGDNRENSKDSRFWGFVPERLLCGRADRVLFSFGKPKGYFSQERVGKL